MAATPLDCELMSITRAPLKLKSLHYRLTTTQEYMQSITLAASSKVITRILNVVWVAEP